MARRVFTRLTATSDDGTDTAARASRADLTAGLGADQAPDAEVVLETFVLSQDPTAVAPASIAGVEVLATIIGGEVRHSTAYPIARSMSP